MVIRTIKGGQQLGKKTIFCNVGCRKKEVLK